jgi:hypothetical protein
MLQVDGRRGVTWIVGSRQEAKEKDYFLSISCLLKYDKSRVAEERVLGIVNYFLRAKIQKTKTRYFPLSALST